MWWRGAQRSCWLLQVLTPKLPPNTKLVDVVDQLNPKEQGVVEAVNLVNGALDRCHPLSPHCKNLSSSRPQEAIRSSGLQALKSI